MPNIRESMNRWLDKKQPGLSEWVPLCQKLSDDSGIQAFCLRLAEDYEAKKIPDIEFLASLSNITGKSLDDIDGMLNGITESRLKEGWLASRKKFVIARKQYEKTASGMKPIWVNVSRIYDDEWKAQMDIKNHWQKRFPHAEFKIIEQDASQLSTTSAPIDLDEKQSLLQGQTKEPWQMTREEFEAQKLEGLRNSKMWSQSSQSYKRILEGTTRKQATSEWLDANEQAYISGKDISLLGRPAWSLTAEQVASRSDDTLDEYIIKEHDKGVKQAITEGKPVPLDALTDYLSRLPTPTIQVDDDVVWHSPHTDEDIVMSFRGYEGDKAVLYNKKSGFQTQVPKAQIKPVPAEVLADYPDLQKQSQMSAAQDVSQPHIAYGDHAWYDPDTDTLWLLDQDDGNNWIRYEHEMGHRVHKHREPVGVPSKIVWPAAIQEIDAWEYAIQERPDIPKQFIADDLGTYMEEVSKYLGREKYHEILQIAEDKLGIMSGGQSQYMDVELIPIPRAPKGNYEISVKGEVVGSIELLPITDANVLRLTFMKMDKPNIVSRRFVSSLLNLADREARAKGLGFLEIRPFPGQERMYLAIGFEEFKEDGEVISLRRPVAGEIITVPEPGQSQLSANIKAVDNIKLTGSWIEGTFNETQMRNSQYWRGIMNLIKPNTLEMVIMRKRDETYGLVGEHISGKRMIWFVRNAQLMEGYELRKQSQMSTSVTPEVMSQIDRLREYVKSGLGEVPKEITYYKEVGGFGGIVKWQGRLYRMSNNKGINAAHLGALGGKGDIKITRVPSSHPWSRLFHDTKKLEELPILGENAKYPPLKTIAPKLAIPKAVTPMGTCYEDAWRFQNRQGEGTLIHGSITGADGRTVKHAWVETEADFIYEPQSGQFIEKSIFEKTFRPVEDARYSAEEAAIQLAKKGYHGAWAEVKPVASTAPVTSVVSVAPGQSQLSNEPETESSKILEAPITPEIPVELGKYIQEIRSALNKIPEPLRKQIIRIEKSERARRGAAITGWGKKDKVLYLNPAALPEGRTLESAILHEAGHLASEFRPGLPWGQTDVWKKAQGWELKHGVGKAIHETYWSPKDPEKVYDIFSPEEDFADAYAAYILSPESLKVKSPEAFNFMQQSFADAGEPMPPEYEQLSVLLDDTPFDYSIMSADVVGGESKIDSVLSQLKAGVNSIQDSDSFRQLLDTMAKFHNYSIGNTILIMLQRPTATRVAGFNTWKDLGRYVKKGEKGISILAPVISTKPICPACKKRIPENITKCPECGAEIEPGVREPVRFFKVVYVFDISQTEGKPLPELEIPVVTGNANEQLFTKLLLLMGTRNVNVSFDPRPDINPEIKGLYNRISGIWVKPDEPRAQQLKSLTHEVAHYYSEDVFQIPRSDAETIAEGAAYVVCQHYGFDTGVRSFPYIAWWAQDKDVLNRNLNSIRNVSTVMISGLG